MAIPNTFRVLRRRHVLLELSALASVAIALTLGFQSGTQYSAQTQVLLTQRQVYTPGDQGVLTQQKLNLVALNYARIVATPEFVRSALESADVNPDAESTLDVTGAAFQNSSIVEIRVSGESKSRVQAAAIGLQDTMLAELEEDQAQIDPNARIGARVVEEPTATSSSTSLVFVVFAALVVGVMLAATLALLLENEEL